MADRDTLGALPTPRSAPRKHGMVQWYAPFQLLSTGVEVLISAAMGQRFDYRLMEDAGPPRSEPIDYDRGRLDIWFDFLADTGDGWNSTHAIASLIAKPTLEVQGVEHGEEVTRVLQHGEFLIMGGDEVYPVASQRNYRERLVAPFEAALPRSDPQRGLYAIPGNHDWYDGLVSFSRRFAQGRSIGGWKTEQTRSYFALKLPNQWWLWALDVQLESDIDPAQRQYFTDLARRYLRPEDRLIVISAEPDWVYRDSGSWDEAMEGSNLAYLEQRIISQSGATAYVWLSGDLHHYRRHEKRDDPRFQRITSGGGGAYLYSTHGPLFGASTTVFREIVSVAGDEYEPKCSFPSPSTSFRLTFLNFLFLFRNWRFGVLPGIGYAAFTWGYTSEQRSIVAELVEHPSRLIVMLLILTGFIFFADAERRWFRWIGGLSHGAAHLAVAILIADVSARYLRTGTTAGDAERLAANFVGGFVLGSTLWGLYLFIAINFFGAQANEAFSSLRIQDYKHFLRLHITPAGVLEIFPVGMRHVPRRAHAHARYMLIEGPIRIDPR